MSRYLSVLVMLFCANAATGQFLEDEILAERSKIQSAELAIDVKLVDKGAEPFVRTIAGYVSGESYRADIGDKQTGNRISIHSGGQYTNWTKSDVPVVVSITRQDVAESGAAGPIDKPFDIRLIGLNPTGVPGFPGINIETVFGKPHARLNRKERSEGEFKVVEFDHDKLHFTIRARTVPRPHAVEVIASQEIDKGKVQAFSTSMEYGDLRSSPFPLKIVHVSKLNDEIQYTQTSDVRVVVFNQPLSGNPFELESLGIPPGRIVVRNPPDSNMGTIWNGKKVVSLEHTQAPPPKRLWNIKTLGVLCGVIGFSILVQRFWKR